PGAWAARPTGWSPSAWSSGPNHNPDAPNRVRLDGCLDAPGRPLKRFAAARRTAAKQWGPGDRADLLEDRRGVGTGFGLLHLLAEPFPEQAHLPVLRRQATFGFFYFRLQMEFELLHLFLAAPHGGL